MGIEQRARVRVCEAHGNPRMGNLRREDGTAEVSWSNEENTNAVRVSDHSKRGRRRDRPEREAGHRDWWCFGHRDPDSTGAGRRWRRSDACGTERGGGEASRGGHRGGDREPAGQGGVARPRRHRVGRRVCVALARATTCPGEQRRGDGPAGTAHARRMGDAVRDQSPGPLRAGSGTVPDAGRRWRSTHRVGELERASAQPGCFRRHPLRVPAV